MIESLDCVEVIKVTCICDYDLRIEASTCKILSIHSEGDSSNLLVVGWKLSYTPSHLQVPESKVAIHMPNTSKAI
jgi:hypothetical protein